MKTQENSSFANQFWAAIGRNQIATGIPQQEKSPEDDLTSDDIELINEIAKGVTTEVAARNLDISARTLRRMIRSICDQLGVNTPIEAVTYLASRGILQSPSSATNPRLSHADIELLAEIATGATTEVAARHLEIPPKALRRRIRNICDVLGVHTPIEAVVWAARHNVI